jgi:hypothetical protein
MSPLVWCSDYDFMIKMDFGQSFLLTPNAILTLKEHLLRQQSSKAPWSFFSFQFLLAGAEPGGGALSYKSLKLTVKF